MGHVRSEGPWTPAQGGCLTIATGHVAGRDQKSGGGTGLWAPRLSQGAGCAGWGIPGPRVMSGAPWGVLGREEAGALLGVHHRWGRALMGEKEGVDHRCGRAVGAGWRLMARRAFKMGDGSWGFSGQSTLAWR